MPVLSLPPSPACAPALSARPLAGAWALSTQLSAAFAALLALMLLVVGLAAWHLRAVQLAADRVVSEEWPRLLALQELASHAQGHGAAMARLLTAPRAKREGIYPRLDAESAEMDRLTAELRQRITEPEALALVQAIDGARHHYREVFAEVGVWIESGEPARAAALFAAEGEPALERLVKLAGELAQAQQLAMVSWQAHAAKQVRTAEAQLISVTLLALAAAALLAWRIGRGVARPMARLAETAHRLALGDLQARVRMTRLDGPCEVERVGGALDAMAEAVDERNARIEAIAYSDPITGVPNRAGLLRACTATDEPRDGPSQKPGTRPANTALVFDVARLAAVNDVLGAPAGDAMLHNLACRLYPVSSTLGWEAAHLGAGTFAVMGHVRSATGDAEVEFVRAAVLAAITEPVMCADVSIEPQFRCGWSRASTDDEGLIDPSRVLREAEEALSEAKRLRVDVRRFQCIDPQRRRRQLVLLGSLKQAAASGGLKMWLQPKVALSDEGTSMCQGFEALVRWRHPEWGMVSPAEFIPFAEAAGMVGVITRCMVEQALEFLAQPSIRDLDLHVSVNVSTADLLDVGFADWLCARARRVGAPLDRLTLEITEGRLMDDAERALPRMHALRQAGVRWSIDDFGTGYSSLGYLQRLPVSELKIDRSFVDQVDLSPQRLALLGSIVQMGHGLGLQVTAEGIERDEERAALHRLGADLGQGWLFARPMPPAEALAWMAGLQTPPRQPTELQAGAKEP